MVVLTTILNVLLSVLLGFIVGYLSFSLVAWVSVNLIRPVVVVDGVEHPVMPVGQILFSFIVAIAVGLVATRWVYKRISKRNAL